MIGKILFDGEDRDTMLSVFTDNGNNLYIQLKTDSGCEVFFPTLKQLLKLRHILDDHISDIFEREAR